jgi:hypothetical protein
VRASRLAERICCCPVRPVVVVLIPSAAVRPRSATLVGAVPADGLEPPLLIGDDRAVPPTARQPTDALICRNECFLPAHIYARPGMLTRALSILPNYRMAFSIVLVGKSSLPIPGGAYDREADKAEHRTCSPDAGLRRLTTLPARPLLTPRWQHGITNLVLFIRY